MRILCGNLLFVRYTKGYYSTIGGIRCYLRKRLEGFVCRGRGLYVRAHRLILLRENQFTSLHFTSAQLSSAHVTFL